MVYYRKYRPQTISELDLSSVREKLAAILSSKSLPHAFLFTGSKGLGKTSSARILAKAINCLNPVGIEPCNKCEACTSITNGSNIDVLEIDAASNGGVEEMRTLRERVKFASSTLKYKVYIIDEVHMLSTGAFNALLKTLEEPPSHVIFVLATTELHKLPETVVSRTFQIRFEKPTEDELVNSLQRIVKGEKLKVKKGVLSQVYRMADGSFRDGAKLLEELALVSNGAEITQELLATTFNSGGIDDEVYELLKAYAGRDSKKALEVIDVLYTSGVDFKAVIARLVDHLRGLLMLRNGIKSEEKEVSGLSIGDIKDLLTLANEAYGELRVSIIPQLPLELMTVKFCIIDGRGMEGGERKMENGKGRVEDGEKEEVVAAAPNAKPAVSSTTGSDILPRLIAIVNETNKPAAALLRSCKEVTVSHNLLTIVTPFPIHADRLNSDRILPDLKRVVKDMLGDTVEVIVKVLSN
jgi:DNA polymerase-3 subunit gamma/tau